LLFERHESNLQPERCKHPCNHDEARRAADYPSRPVLIPAPSLPGQSDWWRRRFEAPPCASQPGPDGVACGQRPFGMPSSTRLLACIAETLVGMRDCAIYLTWCSPSDAGTKSKSEGG
jgi:hypothetical protein